MGPIHVVGLLITAGIVSVFLSFALHDWRTGEKKKACLMGAGAVGAMFFGMFAYHLIAILVAV